MEIEYILFASFSRYMPVKMQEKPCVVSLSEGATIGTLIEFLNLPKNSPKMIFLNGVRVEEDVLLENGNRVGIFPLVAGG
ncbi:MAG: MoaD/ThiS family protein [Desulfobacterales bacterium]